MAIRPSPMVFVRRLVDGAIVVLVVAVLMCLGLGRVLPLLGNPTLIIGGPSMGSALPLGSVVILDRVAPTDLRPGDIVTVHHGAASSPYTHRVTRLLDLDGQRYLETKGDANLEPDPATVPGSAVVGRVAIAVPWLGFLLALLTIPAGVIFILGLGFILIVIAMLLEALEDGRSEGTAGIPPSLPGPALEGRVARHLAATRRSERHAVQRPH